MNMGIFTVSRLETTIMPNKRRSSEGFAPAESGAVVCPLGIEIVEDLASELDTESCESSTVQSHVVSSGFQPELAKHRVPTRTPKALKVVVVIGVFISGIGVGLYHARQAPVPEWEKELMIGPRKAVLVAVKNIGSGETLNNTNIRLAPVTQTSRVPKRAVRSLRATGYSTSRVIPVGTFICTDDLNQHVRAYHLARNIAGGVRLQPCDLVLKTIDVRDIKYTSTADPKDPVMDQLTDEVCGTISQLPIAEAENPAKAFKDTFAKADLRQGELLRLGDITTPEIQKAADEILGDIDDSVDLDELLPERDKSKK